MTGNMLWMRYPGCSTQNKPIFFVDALPWQLHFIHQHLMKQTSENAHHDP